MVSSNPETVIPVLVKLADDEDPEVRGKAAENPNLPVDNLKDSKVWIPADRRVSN